MWLKCDLLPEHGGKASDSMAATEARKTVFQDGLPARAWQEAATALMLMRLGNTGWLLPDVTTLWNE